MGLTLTTTEVYLLYIKRYEVLGGQLLGTAPFEIP